MATAATFHLFPPGAWYLPSHYTYLKNQGTNEHHYISTEHIEYTLQKMYIHKNIFDQTKGCFLLAPTVSLVHISRRSKWVALAMLTSRMMAHEVWLGYLRRWPHMDTWARYWMWACGEDGVWSAEVSVHGDILIFFSVLVCCHKNILCFITVTLLL